MIRLLTFILCLASISVRAGNILEMLPMAPPENIPNSCGMNSKFFRQTGKQSIFEWEGPYVENVRFFQFRPRRSLSIKVPTLSDAVMNVVCSSSKKKMFWPYAWWVVAFMEDHYSVWNWAVSYKKGDSMSQFWAARSNGKLTISLFVSASLPRPTATRIVNFSKESVLEVISEDNIVDSRHKKINLSMAYPVRLQAEPGTSLEATL